jgi:hypothetical protein
MPVFVPNRDSDVAVFILRTKTGGGGIRTYRQKITILYQIITYNKTKKRHWPKTAQKITLVLI